MKPGAASVTYNSSVLKIWRLGYKFQTPEVRWAPIFTNTDSQPVQTIFLSIFTDLADMQRQVSRSAYPIVTGTCGLT
jgi:hypothetical protein